jgi:hypothetical protein
MIVCKEASVEVGMSLSACIKEIQGSWHNEIMPYAADKGKQSLASVAPETPIRRLHVPLGLLETTGVDYQDTNII